MACLVIVATNITDPKWVNEYLMAVTPLVKKFEGRYLTRTPNVALIEGEAKPQFSLVAEFASQESAQAFYDSDEYAPYKAMRQAGSQSQFLLVPIENETR